MQTTQKHIDIIESLRLRAVKDKSLLNGSLTLDEKKRFSVAIQGLEATKKRMQISLKEQEKANVIEELEQLNA
jgi:hypothetical protein